MSSPHEERPRGDNSTRASQPTNDDQPATNETGAVCESSENHAVYAAGVLAYREAGWPGVIPAWGPGDKRPVRGFTGDKNYGVYPDDDQIVRWAAHGGGRQPADPRDAHADRSRQGRLRQQDRRQGDGRSREPLGAFACRRLEVHLAHRLPQRIGHLPLQGPRRLAWSRRDQLLRVGHRRRGDHPAPPPHHLRVAVGPPHHRQHLPLVQPKRRTGTRRAWCQPSTTIPSFRWSGSRGWPTPRPTAAGSAVARTTGPTTTICRWPTSPRCSPRAG